MAELHVGKWLRRCAMLAAHGRLPIAKNRRTAARRSRFEPLESRWVFAAPTLADLPNVTLLSGAQLQIALDGADSDGDALTYSFESTNAAVTTYQNANNRSLKISVTHASSGASDPAFAGDMVFELFDDLAPRTAGRIAQLASSGFYNGIIFHRIINNFMIQGGDPLGTGTGGSGVKFDDEFNPLLQHTGAGVLSMAKSNDDTNDSQFFVTETPQRGLDFNHSIFGHLTEGESIRQLASNVVTGASDKPVSPVTMTSVTVFQDTQNRVLTLSAPNGTTGGADVTVTVSDGNGGQVQKTFHVTILADTNNNTPFLLDIPPIQITQAVTGQPNTVNFQLNAVDVEGNPIVYLFNEPSDPTMDADINLNTGAGTLTTSSPNAVGVKSIFVGVASNQNGPYDTQAVPIFINPTAPTGVTLLATSDTGGSNADHITRLDNSGPANTLQFQVTGVVSGRLVQLFDGDTLIGQATASGTSVTVTTNGTAALSSGVHSITAKQVLTNQAVNVGNDKRTVDLASPISAGHSITIAADDWTNPTEPLDVNANGDIVPLDALLIINELNENGSSQLGPGPASSTMYMDTDGDGFVKPLDALLVINHLNEVSGTTQAQSVPSTPAKAEASVTPPTPANVSTAAPLSDDAPHITETGIALAQPRLATSVFESAMVRELAASPTSLATSVSRSAAADVLQAAAISTVRVSELSDLVPSRIDAEIDDELLDLLVGPTVSL